VSLRIHSREAIDRQENRKRTVDLSEIKAAIEQEKVQKITDRTIA